MADKFYEYFFVPRPTFSNISDEGMYIYRNSDNTPVKWSAKFALPEIGERIFITMNGIGWAVVRGYFESCGYIGVMTKPTRPPAWLVRQNKQYKEGPQWLRDGIGCEFGSEVALKRPKSTRVMEGS